MTKILLIDDDERLGGLLADFFSRYDLELCSATHPEEGLKLLHTEAHDQGVKHLKDAAAQLTKAIDQTPNNDELLFLLGRTRFYLEQDNYHRDTQVKPAWDRALDQLSLALDEVITIERQLDAALDEGRRSGVPPGWLREGIEFEPQDDPVEEVYIDPAEPVILDESNW